MTNPENFQTSLYYVIPSQVFDDESLKAESCMLYALISGLSSGEGYCYASNEYLAKRMKLSSRRIQVWMVALEKRGYIRKEIERNSRGTTRKIFITHARVSQPKNQEERGVDEMGMGGGRNRRLGGMPKTSCIVSETYKEYRESEEEKSDVDKSPPTPPPGTPSKKEKKEVSLEATEAANKLWENVLKIHPKHKPPQLGCWAEELEKMKRLDKRTWEDINAIIDFASQPTNFWGQNGVIQSPESLRKHFDKIYIEFSGKPASFISPNKELVLMAKSQLKKEGASVATQIYLGELEVIKLDTGERISLTLEKENFKQKFLETFRIKCTE